MGKKRAMERSIYEHVAEGAFLHFWRDITRDMPHLPAYREEMEETRRLPAAFLQWFYQTKIFKFFVPLEFGGLEAPLPLALRTYEALSALDGNIGWLAQIGAGGGYFVPSFPHEIAKSLFSDSTAVIAGTGFPSGTALPVSGGYIVRGMWKYASGAQYASLFTANTLLIDKNGTAQPNEMRAFAFDPEEVAIVEDWDAFGLQGTSSHSFSVKERFIPKERSFIVGEVRHDYDYPLYRFPFDTFAVLSIGAVCIGLVRGFIDRLLEMEKERQPAELPLLADRAVRLKEDYFQRAEDGWKAVAEGKELQEGRTNHLKLSVIEIAHEMRRMVYEIFPKLGMRVLSEKDPLNRIFRDLETACHHVAIRDNPSR